MKIQISGFSWDLCEPAPHVATTWPLKWPAFSSQLSAPQFLLLCAELALLIYTDFRTSALKSVLYITLHLCRCSSPHSGVLFLILSSLQSPRYSYSSLRSIIVFLWEFFSHLPFTFSTGILTSGSLHLLSPWRQSFESFLWCYHITHSRTQ